ncbi:NepR family anti-sigma factor [Paracoccus sp. MBLB3053]|uniref:NepR family anti-sigma factor n=1 Tax=Paracoccus aurantius TaxID=3073814 RepID=A0ABU2HR86_9RHOB|nr:NepR family anti-sigma factor [Paracoccus sp. MBLB3053]MDS9466804.1 NepR family anti-sigma factor [Paracoccus sp. MBLB3053]
MNTRRDDRRKVGIEKQIDENLKRVYEQDANQKIPDKFLELLDKLREQE